MRDVCYIPLSYKTIMRIQRLTFFLSLPPSLFSISLSRSLRVSLCCSLSLSELQPTRKSMWGWRIFIFLSARPTYS